VIEAYRGVEILSLRRFLERLDSTSLG